MSHFLFCCWWFTTSEMELNWALLVRVVSSSEMVVQLLSSAEGLLKSSEHFLHLQISCSLWSNCSIAILISRQRRAYSSGFMAELTRQRVLQKAKALCWLCVRTMETSANMKDSAGSQQPTSMSRIKPKVRARRISILMRAFPVPAAPWILVMEASWRWALYRMRA